MKRPVAHTTSKLGLTEKLPGTGVDAFPNGCAFVRDTRVDGRPSAGVEVGGGADDGRAAERGKVEAERRRGMTGRIQKGRGNRGLGRGFQKFPLTAVDGGSPNLGAHTHTRCRDLFITA